MMMMNKIKKTIQVTQKHIEEGQPENCSYCAVALAVKDKFPKYDVSISERYDLSDANKMIYSINLYKENRAIPSLKTKFNKYKEVNKFIDMFDSGSAHELKPIDFDLTVYEL